MKVTALLCWKKAVTTSRPVVAPVGTLTCICVLLHFVHGATLPLMVTEHAFGVEVKCLPLISILSSLDQANGINDSGEIVATGQVNGEVHGFLLKPVAPQITSISPTSGLAGTLVTIRP